MPRVYFGVLADGEMTWFDGRDVIAIRQLEPNEDEEPIYFELDHKEGQTYLLQDLGMVEFEGKLTKLLDMYDRVNLYPHEPEPYLVGKSDLTLKVAKEKGLSVVDMKMVRDEDSGNK